MGTARFVEQECKAALTRVRGMPFEWSLNPYRGCQHACVYCYAREYHAKMGRDPGAGFDRVIEVKVNFAEVLDSELRRGRHGLVALGTGTDPYQACEGRYRLTRRSLEALVRHPLPLVVVTKGTLIVRDVDLYAALARTVSVRIWFSIGSVDPSVARALEPQAPPPAKRLEILERLRFAGIEAGVLCAPVVPDLTDSPASLAAVAKAAAAHGAYAFGSRPLKLDPAVKDHYLAFVASAFPSLLPRVRARYGARAYLGGAYLRELERRVAEARRPYRFPADEKHDVPRDDERPTQLQLLMRS